MKRTLQHTIPQSYSMPVLHASNSHIPWMFRLMGLIFESFSILFSPSDKLACQGSWSLHLHAVRVGCERQGCKTLALCQASYPSLFWIQEFLLHHLPPQWLRWVCTGTEPRSSFRQTAKILVKRQVWAKRLVQCLLRCNLFTTAAAQPASWIKPQNLGPADTCSVDALTNCLTRASPCSYPLPRHSATTVLWGSLLCVFCLFYLCCHHWPNCSHEHWGTSYFFPWKWTQMNSNSPVLSASHSHQQVTSHPCKLSLCWRQEPGAEWPISPYFPSPVPHSDTG